MMPTTPITMRVSERDDAQPQPRPCSARMSSGVSPTMRATAPGQSMRWSRRVCGRCRFRATTTRATMPTGTLTRKTQRQPVMPAIEDCPARNPPTTGPRTLEVPKTARK
jgi:hypothetical protein